MAALASEASMDSSNISGFPDIESDCDEAWRELAPGLEAIYVRRSTLGKSQYLKLYNTVYNYCVVKCCNYESIESAYEQCCHALYKRLAELVSSHVRMFIPECQKREDDCESLIEYYVQIWGDFSSSSKVINRIFSYLNQHWIKREIEDGNKNHLLDIYSLCLSCWRDAFLDQDGSVKRITSAVVVLLTKDRQGNKVDRGLISAVQQSYVDLGVSSCPTASSQLWYYKSTLEDAILKSTSEFYSAESLEVLTGSSVTDYLTSVERRMSEEEIRARATQHRSSLEPVIEATDTAFITDHMDKLLEEFLVYLKRDASDTKDIEHMYRVIQRNKHGEYRIYQMACVLKKYIETQGKIAIEKFGTEADAESYIGETIGVYKKYTRLVLQAFNRKAQFSEALDQACIEFINTNSVTRDSKCANKSSQLLAVYCHQLLKKSSKIVEEAELDAALDMALKMYEYLTAKDAFERYYKQKLAFRLVSHLSISDDAETIMLSKLKIVCGTDYSTTLQKMFRDVEASKNLNNDFKKHIKSSGISTKVDLYVDVLNSFNWQLYDEGSAIALPTELDLCTQQFKNFYSPQHYNRKLTWLYSMSRGEIIAYFRNRYILVASTYQISVLLQYNHAESYTVKQLQERTLIGSSELQQVLQIFLSTKLLISDDLSSQKEETIPDHAVFRLFKEYKNKKVRVVINKPLTTDTKREEDATEKGILISRCDQMKAVIVRVLKARKTMTHNDLVVEVIQQLQSKFISTPQQIKKEIEALIEGKYLSRSAEDSNRYNYEA